MASHLYLGLPSGLFTTGFPTKPLYARLISQYVLHDSHISFFSFWSPEQYSVSSTDHQAPHYVVVSIPLLPHPILGPNILLITLFSNTLSLCFSLSVTDQVSHPYKTTGKIIVLCILIFIFLGSKLEYKWFCTEWQQEHYEVPS